MNVQLSNTQSAAVDAIVRWYDRPGDPVFYVAGYAGTGKSTITSCAIDELKARHGISKVSTAAYTGKAASVLRRKGVPGAQTIHSLIYSATENPVTKETTFTLSERSDAAKADLIVLDECSMIDQATAADVLSFGKKVLVLGDPGQLPPIGGAGAFTKGKPDVLLTEVHRQSEGSPILELATMVRKGIALPGEFEKGAVRVLPLNPETQSLVYAEGTQVICGVNRVRWTYNRRIRARRGYEGEQPQTGERIICCRNNRGRKLFNGAMEELSALRSHYKGAKGAYEIDVQLEGAREPVTGLEIDPVHFDNHFSGGSSKKLEIPGKRFDEFDWGYVITCHKAQGSSWEHVTVIDDSGAFREQRNLWLYSAITRAETGLTILTR